MIETFEKDNNFMLILSRGTPLLEALTDWVHEHKIEGGEISGIGAIENVELGYYDFHKKEYLSKIFNDDDYELLSLNGNITLRQGRPFCHCHATMSDRDYRVFGGHLFKAEVAITAEIFVRPLNLMPERSFDENIGLDLVRKQ